MIVSRSADYALRAMVYLARLDSPRYVPANEIANEMRTPPFLLSRILQHLVKGELLLSMKGHHGGFRLRKSPDQVSVLEIIHLIDGPFVVHDCAGKGDCGLSPDCDLRDVFATAEKNLEDVFQTVTLGALAAPRSNHESLLAKGNDSLDHVAPGAH
jgi:Rrf2 family protein